MYFFVSLLRILFPFEMLQYIQTPIVLYDIILNIGSKNATDTHIIRSLTI